MEAQYSYQSRWHRLLRWIPLLFLGLVALRSALLGGRLLVTLIERRWALPLDDFWRLAPDSALLPVLVAALLPLLLALPLAQLVMTLLPGLTLGEQGLYLHGGRRPRFIPWEAIRGVYGTRLNADGRTFLFLRTRKAPWYSRLYGLLLGAGAQPGILISSELEGFIPVMGYVLRALESRPFEEAPPSALMRVVGVPDSHFETLWPKGSANPLPVEQGIRRAAKEAVGVALAFPLVLLLAGLLGMELRASALLLFLIGLAEWPVGSYWLVAVGELLNQPSSWREMLTLYPSTQLPRWIAALLTLLLVILGLSTWSYLLPVIMALVWSTGLLRLLTAHLYESPPQQSWLGTALPLLYQLFYYGLFFYLLR